MCGQNQILHQLRNTKPITKINIQMIKTCWLLISHYERRPITKNPFLSLFGLIEIFKIKL